MRTSIRRNDDDDDDDDVRDFYAEVRANTPANSLIDIPKVSLSIEDLLLESSCELGPGIGSSAQRSATALVARREDVDWGRRASGLGLRLAYGQNVMVEHPARTSWASLKSKWHRMSMESYLLMREKPLGRLKWLLRSWVVLLSPVVHAFKVLRSPELETATDRIKAIGVLIAIRTYRFIEAHRLVLGMRKSPTDSN